MVLISDKKGDIVSVSIQGDINFENARELKNYIQKIIDDDHAVKYIINLKLVNFIDSSGLGTLVSLLTLLKKINGNLKLVGINENIEELFKLTRLNDFFEIYDSNQDALNSFL